MLIHQDILEETQEVLLNCIESIKEITHDNVKDKVDFINKTFKHLQENVITQAFINENNNKETLSNTFDLLKNIRRNTEMFCRVALSTINDKNWFDKKPMLEHWLQYYEDRVEGFLNNGRK